MRAQLIPALATLLLPVALSAGNLSGTLCPGIGGLNTMTDYVNDFNNSDHVCANGILNFTDFTFSSTGADALSSDDIQLVPINQGPGALGNTGFTIEPVTGFAFNTNENDTYTIGWFFQIDSGPSAGGASLDLDPGNVTITQYICADSTFNALNGGATCTNSSTPQSFSATPSNTDPFYTLSPPAFNTADIKTFINLEGTDSSPGFFASIGSTEQIDPGSPEPATILLAPAGLIAFALLRKRHAKQTI